MDYDDLFEELINQGYSEEEALEIIEDKKEEDEHLQWFFLQENIRRHNQ
ncbi:MAG: hypothetical protein IK151_07370 [Erysipelotrichaceae bacterium]|nr:hypothetical protein [Erysipelotrichaceae bacterium]